MFEYSNWRQCIWYNCQNVNQENIGTSFNEAFSKQGVELVEIKVKASFTPNCFIGGATKNWPANYPAKLEWVLYTTNSSYYDDAEVEIFRTKPYALQGYYSQGFMCNAFDNRSPGHDQIIDFGIEAINPHFQRSDQWSWEPGNFNISLVGEGGNQEGTMLYIPGSSSVNEFCGQFSGTGKQEIKIDVCKKFEEPQYVDKTTKLMLDIRLFAELGSVTDAGRWWEDMGLVDDALAGVVGDGLCLVTVRD